MSTEEQNSSSRSPGGILVYTFRRRNQATFDRASRMPLDDAPTQTEGPRRHD